MLRVDSGEVFGDVIGVDVPSGEGESVAVEKGWTGGLESIKSERVW